MYAGWRLLVAFLLVLIVSLARSQDLASGALVYGAPERSLSNVSPEARSSQDSTPPVGVPPIHRPIFPGPIGFQNIVQPAGIIFSGTVVSVAKSAAKGPASTSVTFKVENAIRGVSNGESLTIREWAGLWDRGERYRVGERVFLFLYSPSKLGLTSPVAGPLGRFSIAATGKVQFSSWHAPMVSTDPILSGKTEVPVADFTLVLGRYARLQ